MIVLSLRHLLASGLRSHGLCRLSEENLSRVAGGGVDCLRLDIAAVLRRGLLGCGLCHLVHAALPAFSGGVSWSSQSRRSPHAAGGVADRDPAADPDRHLAGAAGRARLRKHPLGHDRFRRLLPANGQGAAVMGGAGDGQAGHRQYCQPARYAFRARGAR